MEGIGVFFFILFVFASTATLVGLLWSLLAHGLWGHPAGPPSHLSPQEARQWTHAHPGGRDSEHRMSWSQIRVAVREHRWKDVWPVLLIMWGIGASLLFLALATFFLSSKPWGGFIGLALALGYTLATRRALRRTTGG